MKNSRTVKFQRIETQKQMDAFLDLLGDCHDGVVREIHVVNGSFVDHEQVMYMGSGYSVRILLQRQLKNPSAVEIILGDVLRMELNELDEIYSASGWLERSPATDFPEMHLDLEGATFVARKMIYREASEWMGRSTRFGEHFSGDVPKMQATYLEGCWVQCPSCTESWELLVKQSLVACPYCNTALALPQQLSIGNVDTRTQ